MTPVAYPAIPDGRVTCPHDPQKQCLDDEQTAGVITSFADALDAANAKLQWLRNYFGALPD